MGNVTRSIPGFIGGATQQPPSIRLDTQCELQENFHCTVASGLIKRPNSEFVADLGATLGGTLGQYKTHFINRDLDEQYIVVATKNTSDPIRVFDLEGNEMTVRYGHLDEDLNYNADNSVKSYLTTSGNPMETIKMVSIADYTVITNTGKTCAMDSATTDGPEDVSYICCHSRHVGQWSGSIVWETGMFIFLGTTTSSAALSSTNYASAIHSTITSSGYYSPTNFTATLNGSNILITPGTAPDANTIKTNMFDSWGDSDISVINFGEVESFDALPATGVSDGFVVKVHGNSKDVEDDYYLKYDATHRSWTETIGFELEYAFDETTMPHRLVRTDTNEFTFAPILWEDRKVGDDDTCPQPSFIGKTISNVAFHKNRLWLTSDDNIIGSRAGEYFNFWPTSAMDVFDDDPIDIAAASQHVARIRYGAPFEKGFVCFTDMEQMVLTAGDNVFSPKTVAFDPTTAYDTFHGCDPVKLGPDVYFLSPKSNYLNVREYTIVPDSMMQDAYNVTAHVPTYIPKGNYAMLAGCNLTDSLFVWTSADPDTLYVHQFLWSAKDKVQQAWSKWTFDFNIYGMCVYGSFLYLIGYTADYGHVLERIELENVETDSQGFRLHLDHLMSVTGGTYSSPDTTFTLPMDCDDGTGWSVIDAADNSELSANYSISGTTLTIENQDASSKTYYVGLNYTARYRFSEWYMKDQEKRSMLTGRLQLRTLTLSFKDTGYFEVEVTPLNRTSTNEAFSDSMSGIRVGESVIGAVTLLTGEKMFQIAAESKQTQVDIISDSYLPVQIQLGAWEGTYTQRSQSV